MIITSFVLALAKIQDNYSMQHYCPSERQSYEQQKPVEQTKMMYDNISFPPETADTVGGHSSPNSKSKMPVALSASHEEHSVVHDGGMTVNATHRQQLARPQEEQVSHSMQYHEVRSSFAQHNSTQQTSANGSGLIFETDGEETPSLKNSKIGLTSRKQLYPFERPLHRKAFVPSNTSASAPYSRTISEWNTCPYQIEELHERMKDSKAGLEKVHERVDELHEHVIRFATWTTEAQDVGLCVGHLEEHQGREEVMFTNDRVHQILEKCNWIQYQFQLLARRCQDAIHEIREAEAEKKNLQNTIREKEELLGEWMRQTRMQCDQFKKDTQKLQYNVIISLDTIDDSAKIAESFKESLERDKDEEVTLSDLGPAIHKVVDQLIRENVVLKREINALNGTHSEQGLRRVAERDHEQLDDERSWEQIVDEKVKELQYVKDEYKRYRARMTVLYKPDQVRLNEKLKLMVAQIETQLRSEEERRCDVEIEMKDSRRELQLCKEVKAALEEQLASGPHRWDGDYHESLAKQISDFGSISKPQQELKKPKRRAAKTTEQVTEQSQRVQDLTPRIDQANEQEQEARELGTTLHIWKPRYMSQAAVVQRKAIVTKFRREAAERRNMEKAMQQLTERAKAYKTGANYSLIVKDHKKIKQQNLWDRWDVDEYLQVVPQEDAEAWRKFWSLANRQQMKLAKRQIHYHSTQRWIPTEDGEWHSADLTSGQAKNRAKYLPRRG